MPRRVQRINYDKLWNSWIDAMTTSMIRWQRKPLNVCVLVHFFFTVAHFHLALVASSISHFVTAATKFSCCSSNKKKESLLFFSSRSRYLPPFFSLGFAGLPPTFSISLSFSGSLFQICGHENQSKLNTFSLCTDVPPALRKNREKRRRLFSRSFLREGGGGGHLHTS